MKKEIHLKISEDLLKEFRSLIVKKYSEYRKGLLSNEAELALRFWIDLHTKTQTLKSDPPPITSFINVVWLQVKSFLLRNYYSVIEKGTLIPRKHLEVAISYVRGSDKRTIDKWLSNFQNHGFIKPKGPAVYEVQDVLVEQ